MEPKKRKSEIEKDFRTKLFGQFLIQNDLIIGKTFYNSYEIRNKKEATENNYVGYLEEIDSLSINGFNVRLDAYQKIVPQNAWLPEDSKYEDKANQLSLMFSHQLLNVFKHNLDSDNFIKFLDRKITKDKDEKIKDVKSIIYFLEQNDEKLLFDFIKRPKFLMSYYTEVLDMVFSQSIIAQDKRMEIIDTLTSIDTLRDNSNQNIVYKLLNKYIDNPQEHYEKFPNITQQKNVDFFGCAEKTIKIEIDFISLNSYNVTGRDYTHRNEIISIVVNNLKKIQHFKNDFGFKDLSLDTSESNFAIYFTGDNLKEIPIKNCLTSLMIKSLDKPNLYEANKTELTNAEVIHLLLSEDLKKENKNTSVKKI